MKRGANAVILDDYRSRINRVLDYIDQELQGRLSLDQLSRVACFSKYHFHRIFLGMTWETLFEYIQRRRVEKAAYLLRIHPRTAITDIALDCGFSDSAAFARSFRRRFEITASEWRAGARGNLSMTNSNLRQDTELIPGDNACTGERRCRAVGDLKNAGVKVSRHADRTVAYLRHVGPFEGNAELFAGLFERLYAWAEVRDLLRPHESEALIVSHDSIGITDERKLRVSICVTVPPQTGTGGVVGKMTIPGGKYATARFALRHDEYAAAWNWIFGTWLPASGYQPDDRPCFELYDVPVRRWGGKTTVDICVPVRPL
jgi:AraC family transcriptional regulator